MKRLTVAWFQVKSREQNFDIDMSEKIFQDKNKKKTSEYSE